jgi:hypothetical protein
VGTLQTKQGQYRILNEEDFQQLLGLASDVDRLQQGLNLVIQAVRVVQNHPEDNDAIALLAQAVAMLGKMPTALPTRSSFPPMELEDFAIDRDDEVILDPTQLQRPLG